MILCLELDATLLSVCVIYWPMLFPRLYIAAGPIFASRTRPSISILASKLPYVFEAYFKVGGARTSQPSEASF